MPKTIDATWASFIDGTDADVNDLKDKIELEIALASASLLSMYMCVCISSIPQANEREANSVPHEVGDGRWLQSAEQVILDECA